MKSARSTSLLLSISSVHCNSHRRSSTLWTADWWLSLVSSRTWFCGTSCSQLLSLSLFCLIFKVIAVMMGTQRHGSLTLRHTSPSASCVVWCSSSISAVGASLENYRGRRSRNGKKQKAGLGAGVRSQGMGACRVSSSPQRFGASIEISLQPYPITSSKPFLVVCVLLASLPLTIRRIARALQVQERRNLRQLFTSRFLSAPWKLECTVLITLSALRLAVGLLLSNDTLY